MPESGLHVQPRTGVAGVAVRYAISLRVSSPWFLHFSIRSFLDCSFVIQPYATSVPQLFLSGVQSDALARHASRSRVKDDGYLSVVRVMEETRVHGDSVPGTSRYARILGMDYPWTKNERTHAIR